MELTDFTITNSVYVPARVKPDSLFEEKYINIRYREKRIYSDEEVRNLPLISMNHPHYKEWVIRKQSADKLIHYLKKENKPLKILEIGCGNGWLCHQLSKMDNCEVMGSDINFTELQQAARVFKGIEGLRFIYGDIRYGILQTLQFDVIVFAASLQYFESSQQILQSASEHLAEDGEIHILDSAFYKPGELPAAKQRTEKYYLQLGFPEMANHYFHHSANDLESFNYRILYDPKKILFRKNPFPWICIKKNHS